MIVMSPEEALRVKLDALEMEHRRVSETVDGMARRAGADLLEMQRLKRRKLALKDQIAALHDRLLPDIIA